MGPLRPRTRVHLCQMGGATEPGPTGITLLTDNIRADHERMTAKGVTFTSPPTRMTGGSGSRSFRTRTGTCSTSCSRRTWPRGGAR